MCLCLKHNVTSSKSAEIYDTLAAEGDNFTTRGPKWPVSYFYRRKRGGNLFRIIITNSRTRSLQPFPGYANRLARQEPVSKPARRESPRMQPGPGKGGGVVLTAKQIPVCVKRSSQTILLSPSGAMF